MQDQRNQNRRVNKVYKSLHKSLTYLGVERTLFYLHLRRRGRCLQSL